MALSYGRPLLDYRFQRLLTKCFSGLGENENIFNLLNNDQYHIAGMARATSLLALCSL